MITKMNKYSFVIFHRDVRLFLRQLQTLGMVDITRSCKPVDWKSKGYFAKIKRYDDAARSLKNVLKVAAEMAKKYGEELPEPVDYECTNEELLNTFEMLVDRRSAFLESILEVKKLYNEASVWGEFSHRDVEKFYYLGLVPHFYAVSNKHFNEKWKDDYALAILNEENGFKYFVILSEEGEEYNFEYPEAKFPSQPASYYVEEAKQIAKEMRLNVQRLRGLELRLPDLKSQREALAAKADVYMADVSSERAADDHVVVMEGFAQVDQDEKIAQYLDDLGVVYFKEKAVVEDNPPVKLKNNFFTRLFEPIGNLYVLPRYDELDLTPYFAPFYMLFFGMCLGDMGYGLILLILGIVVSKVMPKMKGYGQLISLLGIGAIIMPFLGGTFFGTKIYNIVTLPDFINNFFFSDLKMFWFSIIFGIFQIIFARLLRAFFLIKHKGWQYGMSNIGWSILIVALVFLYAGSDMGTGKEIIPSKILLIISCIALVLILFFSKTEGNIFKRVFGGITSLYDITSYFGDMLSYIRLFGLAMAGGILGMVMNSLSVQLGNVPYVGWLLMLVMLLIGHTFVLGLSCLGAFVHPLRLTFVEFYKNAGFTGGGKAYKPLIKEE